MSINSSLSAQGDTKSYRNVLIFSFFLNIALNPILISGKIYNYQFLHLWELRELHMLQLFHNL